MNSPKYILCGDKAFAVNLKAASSSLISAIVPAHYPALANTLQNESSYPAGASFETARWHASVPKVETTDLVRVLVVRDPVERFRSACAETGMTAEEGLVSTNPHFRPCVEFLTGATKLYRFESDLDEAATELGLALPLPNIPSNGTKPDLTTEELAAVEAKYADDIALHQSIASAGQLWDFPATEQQKAEKVEELKAARDNMYQSDLLTSDGLLFRAHLEAIIDVKTIIEFLTPQVTAEDPDPVYVGYNGADGVAKDIQLSQFVTALNEGAIRKMQAFAIYNAKKAQVEAATTESELTTIQFNT